MIIFRGMASKYRVYFGSPARTTSLRYALIPPTLRSHLDATISSYNLCDSSLCLFGCAQKLRGMYDREETFDLATEVGGTGESSVHCVASLLKVWRAEKGQHHSSLLHPCTVVCAALLPRSKSTAFPGSAERNHNRIKQTVR